MHPLYPLLFQPNLYPVIWGGRKLKPWKGMVADDEPIGESWEVSAVPSCASIVTNGAFAGRPFDERSKAHSYKQYQSKNAELVEAIRKVIEE